MDRHTGILGLVANAATVRAAYYREKAAHIRELAEAEPSSRYQAQLIYLAEQFDALAENAGARPLIKSLSRG